MRLVVLIAAAALSAVASGGCGPDSSRIVLIGLDGLEWSTLTPMIERGELPNLARFVREGASGELESEVPLLSPIIWTTIATGLPPDRHGVLDFTAPDPSGGEPTVITSLHRRAKAFWNILSEQGISVGVVGWWATWPAEPIDNGFILSDRYGYHAFIGSHRPDRSLVYPPELSETVTSQLKQPNAVTYDEAREFMDVTPGRFAAGADLDFADPVAHFRYIYVTMENVTAATKALFKKKRPDVLAVYYEGIDTAGHMYAVYAPPEHPAATADERRQFGGTLAMFYRYQDRLLGELMKTIGTRATYIVVSDHGFMTGADRPKRISSDRLYAEAVRWHRPDGVVLALGPGIGGGTKIEGATIRDVCPTLLALAGVAPSAEMSGRVLPEIVPPERQPVHRVESYEDPRWLADRQATLAESAFEDEMMSRLTALGYISAEGGAASRSARSYVNLGAYYSGRGEPERAAEMFRKALEIDPGNPQAHSNLGRLLADRAEYSEAIPHLVVAFESDSSHFLVGWSLAMAYGNVGRAPEAVPILEHLVGVYPDVPELRVNLGVVYRLAGRLDEARAVLERAVEERPESVAAWGNLGDTYAAMGRTDEAADAYRRALEIDPDDPHASARLARLRRNER